MESRAYARLVAEGRAHNTSPSEIALLLRAQGPEFESTLSSEAEIEAIADASAEAGATMDAVFADAGVSLDADARSTLLVDAAVELAANVLAGLSLEVAHEDYVEAALDAYTSAGADFESLIMATAGAASTFDAPAGGDVTDNTGTLAGRGFYARSDEGANVLRDMVPCGVREDI